MAEKRPYPSFLIFRDKEGNWRWNYAGPGGRILAASSQAYSRGAGCVRAIRLLKESSDVPIVGRQQDLEVARASMAGRQAAATGAGAAAAIETAAAKPAGSTKGSGKKAEAASKDSQSGKAEKKSK